MRSCSRSTRRDFALSLSKGGRAHQACFDKLSTGLEGWAGEGRIVCSR